MKEKKNQNYYYDILVASKINQNLTYKSCNILPKGIIVEVSLRNKKVLGLIIKKTNSKKFNYAIKAIEKEYLGKIFSQNLISFLKWFTYYNYLNLGQALKLFLPNKKIIELVYSKRFYVSNIRNQADLGITENNILNFLFQSPKTEKETVKKLKIKSHLFNSLKDKKLIIEIKQSQLKQNIDIKKFNLKKLSEVQNEAYDQVINKIRKKNKKPIFLDGVTGSGKTEVYFKVIKDFLKLKKQILVMLPEIALSEQWLERFKSSFGFYPLVWNSKVKLSEKRKIWNMALQKEPLVFVGARSSLFLPYQNLGLIIIDEENDQSYKQEEGVIYNARDMAVIKTKIEKTSIILVSATPSLETYKNCKEKKYALVKLKKRFKNSISPKIKVIDMKNSNSKLISERLQLELNNNIKKKKQSLILINRRGYAPISLCTSCGAKRKCAYCDTSLVYHKENNVLICHQCARKEPLDGKCGQCGNKKFILLGVGLEKIFEEVKKFLNHPVSLIFLQIM